MAGTVKDESIDLINLIKKISDKLGVPTVKKYLSDLDNSTVSLSDEKAQLEIIKTVARHLQVKTEFLTDKNQKFSRDEKRNWGITYICVLLNKYLLFKHKKIAPVFDMGHKSVESRINEFNKLDRCNQFDVVRLQVYDKIEADLIAKKIIKKVKN